MAGVGVVEANVPPLLAAARKAGLTVQDIARRYAVREVSAWRWLNGKRRPPLRLLSELGLATLAEAEREYRRPRISISLPAGMDAQEAERVCIAALAEVRGK